MRVFIRYRLVIDEVSCSTPRGRGIFDFALSLSERYPGSNRWYRISFEYWIEQGIETWIMPKT